MSIQISKEVLRFFNELKKNNNREWFTENKKRFKALEADVKAFYTAIHENLNQHDDIDKMKLFRIYRDVRFSKDKTPYKTHFGGSFHRSKPRLRGGYYLHIASGDSFLAAGFWEPNPADLMRIRKEFELDSEPMRNILADKQFSNTWGGLVGDEAKTAPKGFNREDPNIDLIRKQQFIFTKKFSDKELTADDFLLKIDESFRAIRPYFDYMSEVLTTDLNGVSLIKD